ncbi:MAG: putative DNA binding domain-containing protein [Bifidobacteriaceae bacterium]|nr:putative DNA binding domain-containing protein [Bifidobacteriaceae bacterium]
MTEIDHALALPPREALALLATLPESQWFERKSARIAPRDLAVPLIAMANADGGYVVVGIWNGQVEGIGPKRVNDLRQAAVDFTRPPVSIHVSELPAAGGSVLVFRVDPGEYVHANGSGDAYLRIGDESRKLSYAERQDLESERGTGTYDGRAAHGVKLADLDPALLADYQTLIGSSTVERMLRARSLMTRDDQLTIAALLLFCRDSNIEFPNAHVRVLRYTEPYRGTGAEQTLDADGDIRFDGPLAEQIDQAAAQIETWLPKRRALAASGRFEPVPILPRAAWLEGLVNAVVHRNYANHGEHIRVEIFPDRLEITNPGRFPGRADPIDPTSVKRIARNPRIVRVLADMHIGQELGEGIRRMFEVMRHDGLWDPAYRCTGESVRLTLFARRRPAEEVPTTASQILAAMRQAALPLGTSDIAALAGVSQVTAGRHLKTLATAGLVTRDGGGTRDPHATWRLTDA